MAKTFAKLISADIGSTELDSTGVHTLATTGTNSFIIKDVYVTSDQITLKNTVLKVNGQQVADLSRVNGLAASGTYQVPPSSTITVESTDFPVKFYRHNGHYVNGSGYVRYYQYFTNADGERLVSPVAYTLQEADYHIKGSSFGSSEVSDVSFNINHNTLYIATDDGNSSQAIWYDDVTDNVSSSLVSENYTAYGVTDPFKNSLSSYSWASRTSLHRITSSGNYQRSSMWSNPTTVSWSNVAFAGGWPSAGHPAPTSSYPKGYSANGFFWYIRTGNSDTGRIHAKNLENGSVYRFNLGHDLNLNSNGTFTHSIDWDTDTLYFYKSNNQSDFYRYKAPQPWSYYVNTQNSTVEDNGCEYLGNKSFGATKSDHGTGSRLISANPSGGVSFLTTAKEMYNLSPDGTLLSKTRIQDIFSDADVPYYGWKDYQTPVTPGQASALGVGDVTFKINIHGINVT